MEIIYQEKYSGLGQGTRGLKVIVKIIPNVSISEKRNENLKIDKQNIEIIRNVTSKRNLLEATSQNVAIMFHILKAWFWSKSEIVTLLF